MSGARGQHAAPTPSWVPVLSDALALFLAACAPAPERPARPREIVLFPGVERTPAADLLLALPAEIAGLQAGSQVSVSSWTDHGLGTGAQIDFMLERPERRNVEVNLIDLPQEEAPGDGVDGAAVSRALDRAREEISSVAYRIPVTPAVPVADVLDGAGAPVLRCFEYYMGGHVPETRATVMSVTRCAGLSDGNLLLVKMSRAGLPVREAQQPPLAPASFGRALLTALRDGLGRAERGPTAAPRTPAGHGVQPPGRPMAGEPAGAP